MKSVLPEGALAEHAAIVGNVGSGKTYTAKGFVESLLAAKRRVCILDPTGAWWGLRSSADGKKPGYPVVVFGGEHADVPINVHSGAALAHIIATKNLPAIIDLSEMLIGERHKFVTDFAEALYRENRSPLHLVIDEADEFCPQNPMPETRRMLHHVDRIVRRGRIKGFRVMMISQRPAVLNKNVLTQVQTLIALRLTSPQDRKAILAWVEGQADKSKAADVMDTLAKLKRGEGWVWSPGNDLLKRMQFPRITTFDSSRTPGDDEKIAAPTKLAAVNLDEIRETFAAIAKEVTSLADLKKDNKRLSDELARLQRNGSIDAEAIAGAVNKDRKARSAEISKALGMFQTARESINKCLAESQVIIGRGVDLLSALRESPGETIGDRVAERFLASRPAVTAKRTTAAAQPVRSTTTTASGESLPKGEALILRAVAQYPEGVDRAQLSILTGYKQSARDTYISRLAQRGAVESGGGVVTATAKAHSDFGPFEQLPTGPALLAYWLERLPTGERVILDVVASEQGGPVTRDRISASTTYKQSARDTYISRLSTRKLVIVERGAVRAATILFD